MKFVPPKVLEGDSPDAGSGKAGEDEDGEPKTSNGDQPVGSSSSLLEEIISHTSGSTGDLSNSQVGLGTVRLVGVVKIIIILPGQR